MNYGVLPRDGNWSDDKRELWDLYQHYRNLGLGIAGVAREYRWSFSKTSSHIAKIYKKYRKLYGVDLN